MLIPSYAQLMDVLNKESDEKNEVTSRYTIVIAAAKRARQLIEGDKAMVTERKGKPVSTAVDEILKSKIKIVPEGEGTVLIFEKPKAEFNKANKKEKKYKSNSDEDFDLYNLENTKDNSEEDIFEDIENDEDF